jgi:hypothetical protein
MFGALALSMTLLGATVFSDPPVSTSGPGDHGEQPAENQTGETLATYNGMRAKTLRTPAAQWGLAVWCEKHGLQAEAMVHFAEVVRLDPGRDAAWRKLGFKKRNGRWMNEEEIAEEAEQKKADKIWGPRLRKIHKEIHRERTSEQARKNLLAIEDARAVRAIYQEFGGGGAADQAIAAEALSHLANPLSSRLLALLAVYGKSSEVRRQATEVLRGREPSEFLDVLIALMVDPLKYEVRPVSGPGSPGVLFVEGVRVNLRRVYDAPPPPDVTPMPGDLITYDQFGLPIIQRQSGLVLGNQRLTGTTKSGGLDRTTEQVMVYSATEALMEAQRAAASSQAQLASDVAELDTLNQNRNRFNELVIAVAKDATGKSPGESPADWRKELAGGKASETARPKPKPTVDELIAPAYRPNFDGQVGLSVRLTARAPDN